MRRRNRRQGLHQWDPSDDRPCVIKLLLYLIDKLHQSRFTAFLISIGAAPGATATLQPSAENVRPQSARDDIDRSRDRRRHRRADIECPAFDRIDDAARGQCAQRAGELQSFGEADAMR